MMHLYVVHDRLAEESGPVFTAKNDDVARRMYQQLIANEKVSPEEYVLIHIAQYNPALQLRQIDNHDLMLIVDQYVVRVEVENEL